MTNPVSVPSLTRTDMFASIFLGAVIGALVPFILISVGVSVPLQNYLFLIFALLAPFGLFVAHRLSAFFAPLFQIGKFGIVGSSNFFIDLGILQLLIYLSGSASPKELFVLFIPITTWTLYKMSSFLVASVNGYVWNKLWTFQDREGSVTKEYTQYLVVSLIGLFINSVAFSIVFAFRPEGSVETLWGTIGAVAGAFVGLFWNFLGYKFIVFNK
ncbi:MAG: GtrA family protein [Patescibacteria group bacterium]